MDPKTHILVPPRPQQERMELEPVAINSLQYHGLKSNRERGRKTVKLLGDATLHCTRLINLFFKFITSNKDIEAQSVELMRLNKAWCNYVRSKSDKYVYTETCPFFLLKIQFMIGDKKFNEEQMQKIKEAGEVENSSKTL